MLKESIKPPKSVNSFTPWIHYNDSVKMRVKFNKSCLKQDKVTFTSKGILFFKCLLNKGMATIYCF